MKKRTVNLTLVILLFSILQTGCQSKSSVNINPEEKGNWELINTYEGHDKLITDRFKLNGNQVLLKYKVESTMQWTFSSLEVYFGTGAEMMWKNPELKVFNKNKKEGKILLEKPPKSYFLYINPLEVNYHIELYQKKAS